MDARDVMDVIQARQLVNERELSHVKVGVFDVDGVLRGKYISREKFFSALDHGFGFCDVVLGWDVKDQLYDNVSYTGWHTGYPDASVRIVPDTCRNRSRENGNTNQGRGYRNTCKRTTQTTSFRHCCRGKLNWLLGETLAYSCTEICRQGRS